MTESKGSEVVSLFGSQSVVNFLFVADSLDGEPKKLDVQELKSKFGFNYFEVIVSSVNVGIQKLDEGDPYPEMVLYRVKNPMNDNLVVRFIDKEVGYGVFTNVDIEAGAVIGLYSGEIVPAEEATDYAERIPNTKLKVDASKSGGITRFIQHMPYDLNSICEDIRSSSKEEFFKIMLGHGIFFDEIEKQQDVGFDSIRNFYFNELRQDDELLHYDREISESPILRNLKDLAKANVKCSITYCSGKPALYFVACRNIKAKQQLGVSYGMGFWEERLKFPRYFNVRGELIDEKLCFPDLHSLTQKFATNESNVLHKAAMFGTLYELRVLILKHNLDIHRKDDSSGYSRTPLHTLICHLGVSLQKITETKRQELFRKIYFLIDVLHERKQALNETDDYQSNILHYAVAFSMIDFLKEIIEKKICVQFDQQDIQGKKPFDYDKRKMAAEVLTKDQLALVEGNKVRAL